MQLPLAFSLPNDYDTTTLQPQRESMLDLCCPVLRIKLGEWDRALQSNGHLEPHLSDVFRREENKGKVLASPRV